jgi:hypothetical protein
VFDVAFTAVPRPDAGQEEDPEAEPLCAACGAPVAIFPDLGAGWRHRGDLAITGRHEAYDPGHDPGHAPEVAWYEPDDMPEDF